MTKFQISSSLKRNTSSRTAIRHYDNHRFLVFFIRKGMIQRRVSSPVENAAFIRTVLSHVRRKMPINLRVNRNHRGGLKKEIYDSPLSWAKETRTSDTQETLGVFVTLFWRRIIINKYPYHAFVIPPIPVRKGEKENLWRDVRVTYNSVVWARQFLF